MFERVLIDVLGESLARIAADPTLLTSFIESLPLDGDRGEPDAVRELVLSFAAQERPVILGYAREDTTFPVWSIVLAADVEDLRALGDEGPDDDDDEQPEKVSIWNRSYQVLVYAQHPDVTLYLYELLLQVMISRRLEMLERGKLTNLSSFQGAELSPDRIWLPEFLFVRSVMLTAIGERRGLAALGGVGGERQPLRAKRVTGVHVHVEGAAPDGVRHRVRTHRR